MSESTPDTQTDSAEPERSNSDESDATGRIDDDQLPEDLQPTEDNPLAKPPSDDDDEDSGMSLGGDGPEAVG